MCVIQCRKIMLILFLRSRASGLVLTSVEHYASLPQTDIRHLIEVDVEWVCFGATCPVGVRANNDHRDKVHEVVDCQHRVVDVQKKVEHL